MNLHEYQGKQLFADYQLPIPYGEVADSVEQALDIATKIGGDAWMVKAQVHAGGRGKAGGVKYCRSLDEVGEETKRLLGSRLVTKQTDAKGQLVSQVLIAKPCDIDKEYYLSLVVDRASQCINVIASTEGGMDIEEVAEKTPEKIVTCAINPFLGVLPYQCRKLATTLALNPKQTLQFGKIVANLVTMFVAKDLSLVEINPLISTPDGSLLCLDAKVVVDDNALYRQPQLKAMFDPSQEDERENRATEWQLNYIALDGNIGCMVNGAGLAMATMDIIKLYGANPANFLDVGGSATAERVAEAFRIILSDDKIEGILINIFGGIVRCDIIADGIITALEDISVSVPVVVRLSGNNAALGLQKLNESNMKITTAESLQKAAQQIVDQVNSK